MTLQHAIQPILRDGRRVVISENDFKLLEAGYRKACIAADLEKADKQIDNGKYVAAEAVFKKLRTKYGYKV